MELKNERIKARSILIGIPVGDMVHSEFMSCLNRLILEASSSGLSVAVCEQRSSSCVIGRSIIAEQAIKFKFSHVLYLDTDMKFPHDVLRKLLRWEKSFVCCDASTRREPIRSVCRDIEGKPIDYKKVPLPPLIELSAGTTAVALVQTRVSENMPKPWFLFDYNTSTNTYTTEDYYFTRKIIQCGLRLWCDPFLSLGIGHVGQKVFYIESNNGKE